MVGNNELWKTLSLGKHLPVAKRRALSLIEPSLSPLRPKPIAGNKPSNKNNERMIKEKRMKTTFSSLI